MALLVLATIVAAGATIAFERQQAKEDGRASAARAASDLEARLSLTIRTVAGARAVVDPTHRFDLDRTEFAAYAAAALEDPSLTRIAWHPRVTGEERAGFEARIAPIVGAGTGAAGDAEHHFPAAFVRSTRPAAERGLGLDHLTEPTRAVAVTRAVASGEPSASAPVALSPAGRPLGILIYQSVYGGAEPPATVRAREREVVGVMAGVYRLDRVAAIVGGPGVQVADGETVIAGPERVERGQQATVSIAGRPWTVTYPAPVPGMLTPLVILLAGTVLSFAVGLAFWRSARAQRRLARSEERFRAMADASPALILTFAEDGACTYVNREWSWTTGREPADDMGEGWLGAVAEEDADRFRDHFARARRAGSRMDHEIRVRRADGSTCTMLARIAPTREGESGEVAWVGTLIDLTARRAAERARQSAAVERALAREQEALKQIATAIAREEPTERVFSLVVEEALGTLGARAVRLLHPGGEGRPAEVVAAAGRLTGPVSLGGERTGASADAIAVEVEASGRDWGWLVAFGSEAPDARARLEHLSELVSLAITSAETRRRLSESAVTDPLTGLANRRAFDERLASEVARARRHSRPLSLVMIDIDEFKRVNDTHGHQAGDLVLRAVADALAGTTREGEVVARVGGEEFAWLLPDAPVGHAFRAAERARAAVAALRVEPVGGVTVSAGVADLLGAGGAEDLVARADRALYAAKAAGRDRAVADVGEPEDRAPGAPADLALHP